MEVLFLYRTPKKKRYFSALKDKSLKGIDVEVVGYYSLIFNFAFLSPLKKELKPALERCVEEVFKDRDFIGHRAAESLYRLIMSFKIKCLYKGLDNFFNSKKPSKVVIWNGLKHPDIVLKTVLRKHTEVKLFYMENGLMPETTFLDQKGVNAGSSLNKEKSFYIEQKIKPYPDFLDIKGRASIKSKTINKPESTKKDYMLLPFQMERDSQIIDHSPWIKNMHDLFSEVKTAHSSSQLNSSSIVVREHPSTKTKYPKLYAQSSEHLIFDHQKEYKKALSEALVVVTVNSSVGFEALLMNKKVIVLGEAFYALEGLCMRASNQDELVQALDNIEDFEIDQELKKHFLSYLYNDFLIHGDWKQPDLKHFKSFNERFLKL